MANTEDIEARLCAYVDGVLDAAGKAEIERHLSTNPQHAKLIAELSQQRDWLRALPRERAPADVTESLHAQLERDALLSQNSDDDAPILRISHWPQIKAAAAVLLLVFGLAAVVYYVVPGPGASTENLALNVPPEPRSESTIELSDVADPDAPPRVVVSDGTPDLLPRVRSPQELRALALDEYIPGASDVMSNAVPPRDQIFSNAFDEAAESAPSAQQVDTLHVFVQARDPAETQRQVKGVLDRKHIRFEEQAVAVDAPEPIEFDGSQRVLASRTKQTHVEFRSNGNEPVADRELLQQPEQLLESERQVTQDTLAKRGDVQYLVRNLSRQDVDLLCREISDPAAGQVVQVVDEGLRKSITLSVHLPHFSGFGGLPVSFPAFEPQKVNEHKQLGSAQATVPVLLGPPGISSMSLEISAVPPATQPDALQPRGGSSETERVDVVIFVVPEPQERGTESDEPPMPPSEPQPIAPPATEPSSD